MGELIEQQIADYARQKKRKGSAERQRRYYQRHREQRKEYSKRYYRLHIDQWREYNRQY